MLEKLKAYLDQIKKNKQFNLDADDWEKDNDSLICRTIGEVGALRKAQIRKGSALTIRECLDTLHSYRNLQFKKNLNRS